MQLLVHTLLMAVCLIGAYSIPNYIDPRSTDIENNDVSDLIADEMSSVLLAPRAISSAGSTCATTYNNRIQQISNRMTNRTNACFENANRTLEANIKTANQTVENIRDKLQLMQQQLANCTTIDDVTKFLHCTTASFQNSSQLLDFVNTQAQQMEAQFAANQSQIDLARHSCVSAVIGSGKTNLTRTANNYQTCLGEISNQGELFNLLD